MIGVLMLFIGLIVGSVGTAMVLSSQAEEGTATTGSADAESADAESAAANGESQAANNAAGGNAEQQAMMEQFIADTRHFKGDPDAPVTIIEFSDFRCPYCSKFAVEAGAQIDETYVEAGKVRFGYRHAAYQGEPAIRAAEASECAADQDAFWPYHDRLVEHVAVEGQRDFTVENLNRFAEELDLDTAAFAECLESGKYNELVVSETQSGRSFVRGTPMFLVNGQMVSGAQPFETFQRAIDAQLNN
jgi:protein-disulfide isomerase